MFSKQTSSDFHARKMYGKEKQIFISTDSENTILTITKTHYTYFRNSLYRKSFILFVF